MRKLLILEYANFVWGLHYITDQKMLEKVQTTRLIPSLRELPYAECRGVARIFLREVPTAVLSYQKQGSGGAAPSCQETFSILMNQSSIFYAKNSTLCIAI